MNFPPISFDCRHYRVAKPCHFNKESGAECPNCPHFSKFDEHVLIIKLDAIGDVLRSGGLLPVIAARHKTPKIVWVTRKESVEMVKLMTHVDEVIELSEIALARILTGGWDYVYSLSNDLPSASLAGMAPARQGRYGYWLENGILKASNKAAEEWLALGAFDRLKKDNKKSYQRWALDIIGDPGPPLPASLNLPEDIKIAAAARVNILFPDTKRPRLAINVASGGRWPKKMLDSEGTVVFIKKLLSRVDVDIILVGGQLETEKATEIANLIKDPRVQTALTPSSIIDFIAILSTVDALFCGDTLALHVGSSLHLPTIAIFGPTSLPEIPDFDGLIIKVSANGLDCLCCYGDCDKINTCMSLLDIDNLVELTRLQMKGSNKNII